MDAGTLNCPMCGAAAATNATCCAHCGARLATVSCPSCFGMMFEGEKFCPHCGARADRREEAPDAKPQLCPRCRDTPMEPVVLGAVSLRECPRCEGLWCDAETLRQICADREKQAAVLGLPAPPPDNTISQIEKNIRYLPCPLCGDLMNRVNFANYSGVVVDVCREHGTWFDKNELQRVVQFIQDGGLDKVRARQLENLKEEERRVRMADLQTLMNDPPRTNAGRYHGVSLLADLLNSIFE